MTWAALGEAAEASGLALRGGVRLSEAERVGPLAKARGLALLGFVGGRQWPVFAASPEAEDGAPHPLDRWSRRVVSALAQRFDAVALFPFEGPPYWPFQRWGGRAEPLSSSPLGLQVHPRHGLWHSYRGALAFADALDAPERGQAESPCSSCADRPCLSTCPVGAFTGSGYDVDACARWLRDPRGETCRAGGCLARRACPVGVAFAPTPAQARFHLAAFLAARAP